MHLRKWLIFLGLACAAILGVALVAQYGFGLHPCELCMSQRYPYAILILLVFIGAWWAKTPRSLWWITALCAGLLLVDAGIAVYHTGVEKHWFPGPTACTSNTTQGMTLEDLRHQIENAPLVACDQPMLQVVGISMAGWNVIAASLLFSATCVVLFRAKKS